MKKLEIESIIKSHRSKRSKRGLKPNAKGKDKKPDGLDVGKGANSFILTIYV